MDSTNPEPTTICTGRRTLLRGIAVSGALVGDAGTAGATPSFGACRTIRRSGTYTLTRDIGGDRAVCLRITADNVTLGGRGHTVRGPGTFDGNVGILVRGDRVTIRNVEVVDWETDIRFDGNDLSC